MLGAGDKLSIPSRIDKGLFVAIALQAPLLGE